MIANSHQTSTLEVSRGLRAIRFGRMVGWLIVGLVVVSLLAGLFWNQNSMRYPGAERQAATPFQIRFQPTAGLSQQSAYQTPDDLAQVLSWYAQHLGLGHDIPQGDNCVMMSRVDAYLFLEQSLAVTLCAEPTSTLIFINRNIAMH
jgi:hypothetical protein